MAADPIQIMRILDLRGIDLRLAGGQLRAHWRHGDHVPADLVGFIRHFKALIVAEFQERDRLAETVTNAMSLNDAEYGQWVRDSGRVHPWRVVYLPRLPVPGRLPACRQPAPQPRPQRRGHDP